MHRAFSAVLLLALSVADEPPKRPGAPTAYAEYGPPQVVELAQVADGAQGYLRMNVRTKAQLQALGGTLQYFLLVDGAARVLVIPVPELGDGPRRFIGQRVEVNGIVRLLPLKDELMPCRGKLLPESLCADGDLPLMPQPQLGWPIVSLTVIDIEEADFGERRPPEDLGLRLEDLLADRGSVGQTVRVVGLFGGNNLFGELPAGSAPSVGDWVLRQPPHAVWVTGRKPQGKGWRLDPAYKGDGVRWLEVTGTVEKVGGVTLLRANKVVLTSAPRGEP